MLELRLLLVGLFDGLGALLLGLRGFRGRAVRGVALRDGSGCVSRRLSARAVCRGGGVCVWAGASGAAVVWQRATAGRFCVPACGRAAAAGAVCFEGRGVGVRRVSQRFCCVASIPFCGRFRRRQSTKTAAMMSVTAVALRLVYVDAAGPYAPR